MFQEPAIEAYTQMGREPLFLYTDPYTDPPEAGKEPVEGDREGEEELEVLHMNRI